MEQRTLLSVKDTKQTGHSGSTQAFVKHFW